MKRTLLIPAILMAMQSQAQKPYDFGGKYPDTRRVPQTDTFFGTKVADPFRWLEDDRADDTHAWVVAQNKVTDGYLSKIPFRDALRKRLTALWNYEKFSAPFREGGYTYFFKNNGLQNQSVLYRQKGNGAPEVFLDPNTFSKDGTSSLSGINFSKDGSRCAYLISDGGSDWSRAVVIDAISKKQLGTMSDLKFSSIAWKGNEGFYYSTYDKPQGSQLSAKTEHHKLMYHRLGTEQRSDDLIFGGEATPRRYVGAAVTEDQNFLIITAANATYGNELYIQNITNTKAPISPIVTGFEHEQDVIWSRDGKLFIFTNQNAPNKKLVMVDAGAPGVSNWKDVIPETEFPLTVSTAGGKFFAQYLQDAVSKVYQYSPAGVREREIKLPGLGTAGGFSGKQEETDLYYSYTSYVYPPTIFHYDIKSGKTDVFKKPNVKFDPTKYESKQVFYTSADGTKVPMIITRKKGLPMDGTGPTMLYGYGGFSISLSPSFSVSNLAFIEAGGTYAVANLRGGGEYGDKWHNAGTKQQKQNVFNDFIAAGEYLIREKYTSKDRLAISGGSNGGLLVGACMTQRPDLFRVAFPAVGVLDMLRYHKFTAGAGWAYDYGTADDDKAMFDYLYKYSPVHNVKKGTCYPATMVMTGDHDDRVVPAHSFKFASELQAAQSCANPVLIRVETKAGHGAGKPTTMLIDEQTDKWTFLFWNMGLGYAMSGDAGIITGK
jgi:prolyl oligopeptidase